MADRGAARWISSLGDTPVSRSASLGDVAAQLTRGISGRESEPSSKRLSPGGAFSKTSPGMFLWDSAKSAKTLKDWASALRRASSEREKWAHRTNESDSSYWPTRTASDAKQSGAAAYSTESGRHSGTTLTDATVRASRWATPTARDWKDGACPSPKAPTNGLLGRQAPRATGKPGAVLNPQYVELMMGLPIGWTDCEHSVTPSCQSWRLAHSQLLWELSLIPANPGIERTRDDQLFLCGHADDAALSCPWCLASVREPS